MTFRKSYESFSRYKMYWCRQSKYEKPVAANVGDKTVWRYANSRDAISQDARNDVRTGILKGAKLNLWVRFSDAREL